MYVGCFIKFFFVRIDKIFFRFYGAANMQMEGRVVCERFKNEIKAFKYCATTAKPKEVFASSIKIFILGKSKKPYCRNGNKEISACLWRCMLPVPFYSQILQEGPHIINFSKRGHGVRINNDPFRFL